MKTGRSPGWNRREFFSLLARSGVVAAGATAAVLRPRLDGRLPLAAALAADALPELIARAPVARHWVAAGHAAQSCASCHPNGGFDQAQPHPHTPGAVRCLLCARQCTINLGERGMCRARINVGGVLRSLVWGRPMAVHVDPIEKKPFYHVLPGATSYSLATSGCPLRCQFCQNWHLSQARPEDYQAGSQTPPTVVQAAQESGAPLIAFTYNEPTVFFEYLIDIARAAREHGLRSVLVSCGYMNEAPLAEMCDVLAAIKIDLKGINPRFYRDVCQAELGPVLRSIEQIRRRGVHLELVNLVVPTLNDAEADLVALCRWVKSTLGADVPIHFTRFHPDYKLRHLPPTPVSTLERAYALARAEGLRYPYVGNVPGHGGNHTHCPKCKKVVIERRGFFVTARHLVAGKCEYCDEPIAGVWA